MITGFILGASSMLLLMYLWGLLMKYFHKKFLSPRWYPVQSFSTVPESDGTYLVYFYIEDKSNPYVGYTKKCPPDVEPEELEVFIRKVHSGRSMYRVFWRKVGETTSPFAN